MGFLQDRKILVTGLLSNRSIAYGIARALSREGATLAFTYQNEDLRGRVAELAKEFGSAPVLPCDVARDEEIEALFGRLGQRVGRPRRHRALDRVRAARGAEGRACSTA